MIFTKKKRHALFTQKVFFNPFGRSFFLLGKRSESLHLDRRGLSDHLIAVARSLMMLLVMMMIVMMMLSTASAAVAAATAAANDDDDDNNQHDSSHHSSFLSFCSDKNETLPFLPMRIPIGSPSKVLLVHLV